MNDRIFLFYYRIFLKYISILDTRFHSNPVIPVSESLSEAIRKSVFVPVSERRRFFETIAEYSHPF